MKKAFKVTIVVLIIIATILITTAYIRSHSIDVLNAKGLIGIKEGDLIVTACLLMLIVVIPVYILTWFFAWRYKESNVKAKHAPDWEHNYIAEYCWWGVPLIIVVILAVMTWRSSHELNPFKPLETDKKPIVIQVVALQWKWLFLYPEQGIASVNVVRFPVKTPVNFQITSDAPMNSFWIPALGGQIYAMPAMLSKLHLIADVAGKYKGVSAQLSGEGFSGMAFTAESSGQEEFDQWVGSVKAAGKELSWNSYKALAQPSSYQPVSEYVLGERDLFERILMQYMAM